MKLFRILDPFTLTLIGVVLLASFFPARGSFVPVIEGLTTAAIALLFFMHGAKLSREAIIAGGSHWRLHLWVMCSTFILFPVLGVLFARWAPVNVDPALYTGFLYLCILPATVQSAIAFTSLAGGNVAAAVCSASASSLLGIFVSPLLVGLLMNMHGAEGNLEQVGKICLQLLLPFVLGHLSRPGLGSLWRNIKMDRENGPKLHSAGGLHGLQRSRGERHLAQGGCWIAAVYCGGKHRSAGHCHRG